MLYALLLLGVWPGEALLLRCKRTYVASPLERKWLHNIGDWQTDATDWGSGCKAWREDLEMWDVWLNPSHPKFAQLHDQIFSYHDWDCGGHKKRTYLEPLAVALRNPMFPCVPNAHSLLFDTSWLLLPNASDMPHRRALFFDFGSTYYNQGFGGYKDSMAWWMDSLKARGWHFDDVFAWEKNHVDPNDYWRRVPDDMKARLHFFNTPTSADPADPMNPLTFIRRIAKPGDYIVMKLDIDNNAVETGIVDQIIKSHAHHPMIDEFIWENHVKGSPTQWHGWKNLSYLVGPYATLNNSYHAFHTLRQLGIRAHSWV